MKAQKKSGFTLVETALVLAISVLTLVAFIVTISSRIGRERYKDATNSFADFIRRIYSETINVENGRSGSIDDQNEYCTLAGQYAHAVDSETAAKNPDSDGYPGRSGCAIYGKLITFGERYTSEEDRIDPQDDDDRIIYVYDVIGRAIDISHPLQLPADCSEGITCQLAAVNADILTIAKKEGSSDCAVDPVGSVQKFNPPWSSEIETTARERNMFKGALLITRSPSSGAVHTYVLEITDDDKDLQYQSIIAHNRSVACDNARGVYDMATNMNSNLSQYLKDGKFEMKEVNFCVGSDEGFMFAAKRNNIRVVLDNHNATGVEFIETDLPKSEGGNACE